MDRSAECEAAGSVEGQHVDRIEEIRVFIS